MVGRPIVGFSPKPRAFRKDVAVGLTQYYMATTLDGFIAVEKHSLDWLFMRDQDRAGILNYAEFIAGVGALAMGLTTYEWILEHDRARQGSRRVEVAVRHPWLGLYGPAAGRGPGGADRVRERRRRAGARGDGGGSERQERVDRRRRRSRRPVRGRGSARRGHRLHRACDARVRRAAAAAARRAATCGARP